MKKRFLLAALPFVAAIASADAATLIKTYSYFTISGTTLDGIQRELSKRGPHVKSTGSRHPGATRMAFTTKIGYAKSPDYCQIVSAKVTVKAHVILPKWRQRAKADAGVRLFWDTLSSDIKRHEGQHVDIAKNYARELEDALKATGRQKDCEAAAAKAKALTAAILAEHDKAQVQFDRVELVNFESRILRLLQYRAERIESGRLPQP